MNPTPIAIALAALLAPATVQAAGPKLLYKFTGGMDGAFPTAPMIAANGLLYGVNIYDGANDAGAVFAFNPKTNAVSVVASLPAGTGFPGGGAPGNPLTYASGMLYGETFAGGGANNGTVFQVSGASGESSILYSFGKGTDGQFPGGGLLALHGLLYGVTYFGGADRYGTIFAIDPTAGTEHILYSFHGGIDGGYPNGLTYAGGLLYGTAPQFGAAPCSCGTIFSFNLASGQFITLHGFNGGADGAVPDAPMLNLGGILYGTTASGGVGACIFAPGGCGTIFSFDPSTGIEKILYAFKGGKLFNSSGEDGFEPSQPLAALNGYLFGTTRYGGSAHCANQLGCGTIFKFDLATNTETELFAFASGYGRDTANPSIMATRTKLYGTIAANSANPYGAIFTISQAGALGSAR